MNRRLPRQSDPVCQDGGNATGCLPDGIMTAPEDLVMCINSRSHHVHNIIDIHETSPLLLQCNMYMHAHVM